MARSSRKVRDLSPSDPEPEGRNPPLPPDHEAIPDSDAREAVRARLREVGGDAFDRVEIDVVQGEIVLSGEIPNESQRSVALQIVADIAGLPLRADRMRVTVGWETPDTAQAIAPPDTPELDRAEGLDDLNEDPFKSADEGAHYEPPVGPVPEKE